MGDRTLAYLQGYHSVAPLSQRHDSWRQDFRVSPVHDVEVDCRGNFLTLHFNKPPGDELLRAINDLYDKVSPHARRLKPESQILTDGTLLRTAWQTEPQFKPGESRFMIGVMPTYSPGQVAEAIASELEGRYKMRVKRSQRSKPRANEFESREVKTFRLDQRGQGVACGASWISRVKKCSKAKAAITTEDAKRRTAAKSKERTALRGQVERAKGQKAMRKPVPVDPRGVEIVRRKAKEIGSEIPKQVTFEKKGDFTELFGKDAELVAHLFESRKYFGGPIGANKWKDGTPYTGVPSHAFNRYRRALERGGIKVEVKGDRGDSTRFRAPAHDSVPVRKFRLDAKGDGVPCGGSWISSAYKCSRGKAKATPKDRLKKITAKRRGEQAASKAATLEQDFKIANMTQAEFVGGAKNKKTVQKLKETHRQATLNSLKAGRVPKGNKFAQYDYPDISKRFAKGEFDRKPRKNS